MPYVQIEMLAGRTIEEKRKLAKLVTDAVVEAVGSKPEKVIVIINETEHHHSAVGGILTADERAAG